MMRLYIKKAFNEAHALRCFVYIYTFWKHMPKFSYVFFIMISNRTKKKSVFKLAIFHIPLNQAINTLNCHHQFNIWNFIWSTQSHIHIWLMKGATIASLGMTNEVKINSNQFHSPFSNSEHSFWNRTKQSNYTREIDLPLKYKLKTIYRPEDIKVKSFFW